MQAYILGAILGIVYGSAVGALKYFLLWRKLLKDDDNKNISMNGVTTRLMASYAINAAAILSTLLFRNIESINWSMAAITTAVALSIVGRFFSIQKVLAKTNIEE